MSRRFKGGLLLWSGIGAGSTSLICFGIALYLGMTYYERYAAAGKLLLMSSVLSAVIAGILIVAAIAKRTTTAGR